MSVNLCSVLGLAPMKTYWQRSVLGLAPVKTYWQQISTWLHSITTKQVMFLELRYNVIGLVYRNCMRLTQV